MDTTINDKQRRFSGLQRLYGDGATARLEQAHVMVAGIGGVGSWTAEALARSGVGELTLIDLDHIAESNVNRQIHALSATFGQAKIQAMADRIAGINPDCRVNLVDDFLGPDNVDTLLQARPVSVLVDATDQVAAKIAMVLASQREQISFIMCGGAGGKLDALTLTAGDLSAARNDALLGRIRQQLRKHHGFAKGSDRHGKALRKAPAMRVFALWFDQPAILPQAWGAPAESGGPQGLSCAGYGSAVTVTAAMGMAAAGEAIRRILA
ncbi:MAG: tRNA threonylcarbamoyladenosine dehydratase [Advenella sp.]|nr:tRNA threonylcarbamoyladenosine dehydratase [Advenella sp. FME57]